MVRNSFRTFRVWKLTREDGFESYNLEAENGFAEWKITSDLVSIAPYNPGYIFKTMNGSTYVAYEYMEGASRTSIVKQYMDLNNFIYKEELTEEGFLGIKLLEGKICI